MDTQHRKIELQSPSDLTYLTTQLRTAALQKLNLHLPPVSNASEPDDLRRSVEDLVESFIASIIAGMRSNISINGMDVVVQQSDNNTSEGTGADRVEVEEFEAFDEKIRGRVGAMIARRDALVGKISAHRRETPGVAAGEWQKAWERESEVAMQMDGVVQDANKVEEDMSVQGLEREDEIRRNWERAVEGLTRLDKGLPETRARLERAGEVVGYLGAKGGEVRFEKDGSGGD
jgi:kinetochor protein Mis14/NSL1